jgi:hypothetical protein
VIDDHCRLAYAEIHGDDKGATAAGMLLRWIFFSFTALSFHPSELVSTAASSWRVTRFRGDRQLPPDRLEPELVLLLVDEGNHCVSD